MYDKSKDIIKPYKRLIIPNLLLISGSGKNSGKTYTACLIIKKMMATYNILALKVSPHFHYGNPEDRSFIIREETEKSKKNDSSRLLHSGARKVYYIESPDAYLPEVLQYLGSEWDQKNRPVICESGGLINYVHPGLHLYMTNNQEDLDSLQSSQKGIADNTLILSSASSGQIADRLSFYNNKWKIESEYDFIKHGIRSN